MGMRQDMRGFTLIELLVVLAIIATLLTLAALAPWLCAAVPAGGLETRTLSIMAAYTGSLCPPTPFFFLYFSNPFFIVQRQNEALKQYHRYKISHLEDMKF